MKKKSLKKTFRKKRKKLFKKIFGTKKNISFKLGLSLFTTSIIFFCLSQQFQADTIISNIFVFASGLTTLFCFMIIATKKSNNNLIFESVRFAFFYAAFILSFKFIVHIFSFSGFPLYLGLVFACIGIMYCSTYLICKFSDIFNFFKKVFKYIKIKLYDTADPPTSKVKSFIENITALLASIIALFVTVQTIANTIINLFHSLK